MRFGLSPLLLLLAPTLVACTHVEGRFTSKSARTGGEWVMAPTNCYSAQPYGQAGVFFVDEARRRVLVVFDALGDATVFVKVPGQENTELRRGACTVLDGEFASGSGKVNGVRMVSGWVRVACQTDDGGLFAGDVRFDNCSL